MKVSIALCTYNGAEFIKEQIQSILNQTIAPDEIIVCDDGSTDNTLEIIQQIDILHNCKIFRNNTNLGTIKNFEKAIANCKGEIVFLADQDDLWQLDKIEKLLDFFRNNPSKKVVFTDALLVDQEGKSLEKNLWKEVRFGTKEQNLWNKGQEIDVLIQGNRVTGCTMAFNRAFVQQYLPFPQDLNSMNFIHDTWIAWVGAANHVIGFIDQPLVSYRQHEKQQIGATSKVERKKIGFFERFSRSSQDKKLVYQKQAFYFSGILAMFKRFNVSNVEPIHKIERAKNHFENRASESNSFFVKLNLVTKGVIRGDYHHFVDAESKWYNPWLTILGDLFE